MLTLLGSSGRFCDGLSRRSFLQVGSLALGGLSLPSLFQAEARAGIRRSHRSVIMVYLSGGLAHQDTFDLKPNAPTEVRGEFKPIATNVPGIQIGEHLPRMAKWMDRIGLVRSLNHKAGCHNCLPSYTGCEVPQPDQHPRDSHPPSMGSVCEYLKKPGVDLPH